MEGILASLLPWLLVAAVALYPAIKGRKNRSENQQGNNQKNIPEGKQPPKDCRIEGMCLGMCAGAVIGASGYGNLLVTIALGILAGRILGSLIKRK